MVIAGSDHFFLASRMVVTGLSKEAGNVDLISYSVTGGFRAMLAGGNIFGGQVIRHSE